MHCGRVPSLVDDQPPRIAAELRVATLSGYADSALVRAVSS
jgi:hypothetical protein